jgi:hypothetical protein
LSVADLTGDSLMMSASLLAAPPITGQGTTFFVGWFTLALINAGLAQSKNRSGLAWWLISLLLGPLATLLLVAVCDRLPPRGAS